MAIFDRLKVGVVLTKDSLLVIRHNPKLALFPLASGAAGIAFLAVFLGITFGLMAVSPEGGALIGLFLVYLALTFVSSFFTAGLVHQTREVLAGNEAALRAGLDAAWDVKRPLLIWSLISATIGIVINSLENSDSRAARVFGTLFGVAWTLMTFFIIPIIVFEKASVTEMFERSAGTFKGTWGETPISLLGIQLVSTVIALPFVAIAFLFFSANVPFVGVAVLLVGLFLSFLLTQTLQGVVKTTLYLYAKEGTKPEEFSDVDFGDLAADSADKRPQRASSTTGGFR